VYNITPPIISMMTEQRKPELPQLSIVEFALSYARNGWYVFPLHGKFPYKEFHWKDEATTDSDKIAAWWRQHPTANIGLATDSISGVIVLDIDPRNAEKESPNPLRVLKLCRSQRSGNILQESRLLFLKHYTHQSHQSKRLSCPTVQRSSDFHRRTRIRVVLSKKLNLLTSQNLVQILTIS
jgi:hypothetical protein